MVPSLFTSIRLVLRKRRARRQSWDTSTSVGDGGLNRFQEEALAAIRREFGDLAFREEGESDMYMVAKPMSADLAVYVYRDGAALQSASMDVRFERWDYDSPTELIGAFVRRARETKQL